MVKYNYFQRGVISLILFIGNNPNTTIRNIGFSLDITLNTIYLMIKQLEKENIIISELRNKKTKILRLSKSGIILFNKYNDIKKIQNDFSKK